ncbi:MAG: radical SAM family RiPP maturation amino acid epimerase, partial [Clostridiales bacterium]|nr:radical SAM family RiPP maturation amino acid epimerase [Clostridiales bacterium]
MSNSYLKVLGLFTQDELYKISQVKRFFECYEGDADFRTSINAGSINNEHQIRLKQIGVDFEPREVDLLWNSPEIIYELICNTNDYEDMDTPAEHIALLKNYPILELWIRFTQNRKLHYKEACAYRGQLSKNSQFESWRNRRIISSQSELGAFSHYIDHPTLALELSEGCSMQCWFCSFSAQKLKSVLDYTENKDYFRGIVQACTELLGREAASLAMLYYASEPYDNPHYIDYMKDFAHITGSDVCTSTAVCSNKKWIEDLLAYYSPKNMPWPRLSVLSTTMLHKIHENHTPFELVNVNMLMQMKESERNKVSGGRIFEEKSDMRQRDSENKMLDIIPQGTIACVSGFYISLITRRIKLVSPCYTSKKWPYGYRIFDEASFETVDDFYTAIQDMIKRNMPETPPDNMPLKLRDDLVCRVTENGFILTSPNQIHHFENKRVFQALGKLL